QQPRQIHFSGSRVGLKHFTLRIRIDLTSEEATRISGKDRLLCLLIRAEPPFEIVFLAAFLLLVHSLLALKHLFTTLKKILLCERQPATLTRILLDCGVVVYVPTALHALVRHPLACASN